MLTFKKIKKIIIALFYISFLIIIINISCDIADQYLGVNNSLLSDSSDEDDSSGSSSDSDGNSNSTPSFSPLTYNPAVAYATWRLGSSYSGAIVRARLGSGGEVDIYEFQNGSNYYRTSSGGSWIDGTGETFYVRTFYDQSGNSNDAIQATNGNQPQIVLNSDNGYATILFDGSNDYLRYTGSIGISGGQGATGFLRVKRISGSGTVYIALNYGKDDNGTRQGTGYDISQNFSFRFFGGNRIFNEDLTLNQMYVLSFRNADGAQIDQYDAWIDGVLATQESTANNTAVPNLIDEEVTIGASNTDTYYTNMNLGCALLYDTELTDTQKQEIENYLDL